MTAVEEKIKINLNQNLWGLLISFAGLGVAEHYRLCTLYWFSFLCAVIMIISVACDDIRLHHQVLSEQDEDTDRTEREDE